MVPRFEQVVSQWEGWGTSLSFWANVIGNTPYEKTYADLLFTSKLQIPGVLNQRLPGLMLNIVRFNLGGAGLHNETIPGNVQEQVSELMPKARRIEGFWLNWLSRDPYNTGSWNFSRNADQLRMLQLAKQRGVNVFDMISYGAPFWMTDVKSSQGGALQSWNEGTFAYYIAQTVRYAKTEWNVTFDSVEAFNEPSAGWWKFPGKFSLFFTFFALFFFFYFFYLFRILTSCSLSTSSSICCTVVIPV
jgi:galactan endo-1,6-beta-galactosidase